MLIGAALLVGIVLAAVLVAMVLVVVAIVTWVVLLAWVIVLLIALRLVITAGAVRPIPACDVLVIGCLNFPIDVSQVSHGVLTHVGRVDADGEGHLT
jgi:hypothetical protein